MPETNPESSLTAVRKVILPNRSLGQFVQQVTVDARELLGYNTDSVTLPATLEEQMVPGYSPVYEEVPSLRADVLPLRALRVVLFDRHAPAGENVNRLLQNAHQRLISREFYAGRYRRSPTGRQRPLGLPNELPELLRQAQTKRHFLNGRLSVTASSVRNIAPKGADEQVFALMVDDSPAAEVLDEQSKTIDTISRTIQATKGLRPGGRFSSAVGDPRAVIVARVPESASRKKVERFGEVIDLHDPVSFELGPVEWKLTITTPEN